MTFRERVEVVRVVDDWRLWFDFVCGPMIERWPVLGCFVTADGMVGLVVDKVVLVDGVEGW